MNQYEYIGDCATGLEDPLFSSLIPDATTMAQIVDNEDVQELYVGEFVVLAEHTANQRVEDCTFHGLGSLVWIYNFETDMHYFFHQTNP